MASSDYSQKTSAELKALCKEKSIKGFTGKNKEQLIMLLDGKELPKVESSSPAISKEDAEKSATEWAGSEPSPLRDWLLRAIMDPTQHREIGKVLAYAAEVYVNKWLTEKSGRTIKDVTGESWDGVTADTGPKVRNQIKFRMGSWHFETTRRNSQKNAETNSTGHVAYRKDEFDMVAIFKPGPTFGLTGSTIRCIPVAALINPSKPDQLITNIPTEIRKVYDNAEKTLEVIKALYQTPPSPQG